MCGIVGYVSLEPKDIQGGLDAIKHRGPDGVGKLQTKVAGQYVALGHRRLSIIDLSSSANQPFRSADNSLAIVFNGEIYNYKQLKQQYLVGYQFHTDSDTEVILALYEALGCESFKLLEGMFAFVILDINANRLIFCRDQLGIKPLYYTFGEGSLTFGSEIKGLQALGANCVVDKRLIYEYLLSNFIYEPDTGFKEVYKIKAGTYVSVDLSQTIGPSNWSENTYWTLAKCKKESPLDEKLRQSINAHLVSDVPVGLFYSGGVDSSLVLAEVRESVQALTVKPAKQSVENAGISNDYDYAVKIASALSVSKITEIPLDEDKESGDIFLDILEKVAGGNEELMGDLTFVSSRKISAAAREAGVKVALSGMGADEIFAGYPRYVMMKYYKLLQFVGLTGVHRVLRYLLYNQKSFAKKLDRFMSFFSESGLIYKYISLVGYFNKTEVLNMLKPEFVDNKSFEEKMNSYLLEHRHESPLKKAMIIDSKGFLAHNFMVADKSSMLESLEVRVPLATPNLFISAFSMNDQDLIRGAKTKAPLKQILEKFIDRALVNRSKAGFNPPLDSYISSLSRRQILNYFESTNLFSVLNQNKVEAVLNEHFDSVRNNTYKIFSLLYLAAWLKVYSE